ncbi:gamma carbonic anhydrase family protein [Caballeronia sp. 15711]|uniref:gamma carbonic anhydrase family protein n=1 Tax=Caballeronia sp. 15711 TaxID=3391029 RepID=UPI0039E6C2E9
MEKLLSIRGNVLAYDGVVPKLAPNAFVAATATVIGNVQIGDQASIWYGCILRGDVNSIRIGARSNIQDGTIVHVSPGEHPTVVGASVLVGHSVMLHGCTLEDNCFIGMRASILNGALVESGAIVAAGALVVENTRVMSGELWGGIPARRLRTIREGEIEQMQAAVHEYILLAARHAALVRLVDENDS